MFMAYDWRVVVIEKFLVLHYVEEATLKLVFFLFCCVILITVLLNLEMTLIAATAIALLVQCE